MGAGELNNVDLEKTNKERTMSGSTVALQRIKDEGDLPLTHTQLSLASSKGGTKAT